MGSAGCRKTRRPAGIPDGGPGAGRREINGGAARNGRRSPLSDGNAARGSRAAGWLARDVPWERTGGFDVRRREARSLEGHDLVRRKAERRLNARFTGRSASRPYASPVMRIPVRTIVVVAAIVVGKRNAQLLMYSSVAMALILIRGGCAAMVALLVAMSIVAALWETSFALMFLAVNEPTALMWGRIGNAFVPFMAPAAYQFVTSLLHTDSRGGLQGLGPLRHGSAYRGQGRQLARTARGPGTGRR